MNSGKYLRFLKNYVERNKTESPLICCPLTEDIPHREIQKTYCLLHMQGSVTQGNHLCLIVSSVLLADLGSWLFQI